MVNGRAKGANAEREAGKWLKEQFNLEVEPYRNLEQVRGGGYDLLGFDPFALEVKRCEVLAKKAWWEQACSQAVYGTCPVVMYRKNRQPWRFLIPATVIGVAPGWLQLEADVFVRWATDIIERTL